MSEGEVHQIDCCPKCGFFRQNDQWVMPRVDKYIELIGQIGRGEMKKRNVFCPAHEGMFDRRG